MHHITQYSLMTKPEAIKTPCNKKMV